MHKRLSKFSKHKNEFCFRRIFLKLLELITTVIYSRIRRILRFSDGLLLLFTRVLDEFALDEVFLEPIIRLKRGIAVPLSTNQL